MAATAGCRTLGLTQNAQRNQRSGVQSIAEGTRFQAEYGIQAGQSCTTSVAGGGVLRRTGLPAAAADVAAADVAMESEVGMSYEVLRERLAAGEWELADAETRRLVCELAGEGAAARKWVYFSEVHFIPTKDLLTLDSLWRTYSSNRFGFSVQRRIWKNQLQRWKPFFTLLGWTYGVNSTYKKFPMEFDWSLEAPVGHLPLTNALRGTQLFEKLLLHPAFDSFDSESQAPLVGELPTFTGASTSEVAEKATPPTKSIIDEDDRSSSPTFIEIARPRNALPQMSRFVCCHRQPTLEDKWCSTIISFPHNVIHCGWTFAIHFGYSQRIVIHLLRITDFTR